MYCKLFLSFLLFLINNQTSYGQVLSCSYRNDANYGYTCSLTIQNPNGLNNFTVIYGTHLTGMTDGDVRYVNRVSGSTPNVPLIICDTFQNVRRIYLVSTSIKSISENSFRNCEELNYLDLDTNVISEIEENSFLQNNKLSTLRIRVNQIRELPQNIFKSLSNLKYITVSRNQISNLSPKLFEPLKKLETLFLYSNNLTVIHSYSFGVLPLLKDVYLYNNQINAVDEKFIDNIGVTRLEMRNNLCINEDITDSSVSKDLMRSKLQKCFENYKILFPETTTISTPSTTISTTIAPTITTTITEFGTTTTKLTTTTQTLPPGCISGNLDERVCKLENLNEEFQEDLDNKNTLISEIKDESQLLRETTQELRQELEELKNQMLILSTRPCSCN